jgi:glutaryl-CoA dehydrogenase
MSLDYYGIEELITEEERAGARSGAAFCARRSHARDRALLSRGQVSGPPHTAHGRVSFFAPYLKEHGCAGLSHTAYALIMQELERADSGLRSQASVQRAVAT